MFKKILDTTFVRRLVDVTVLLALLIGVSLMLWFVSTSLMFDYYQTLPDEVKVLDTEALALLETAPIIDWEYTTSVSPLSYRETTSIVSPHDIYRIAKASTVYINTSLGIGSGVVLTRDGVIATNYHLVTGAEKAVVTTAEGSHYPVEGVIAYDALSDVALLKINTSDLVPAPFSSQPHYRVGDTVYNLGHPENVLYTFTGGMISGVRNYASQGMGVQLQITNPISAGSSGSPLFNVHGEVVGIVSWSIEYDGNFVQVQNLNFAVPIDTITSLYESLAP